MHPDKLPASQEFLRIILFELFLLIILPGKSFDNSDASQVFLKGGRKDGLLLLIGFINFGYFIEEPQGDNQDNRYHCDGYQRQFPIQGQDGQEIDDK